MKMKRSWACDYTIGAEHREQPIVLLTVKRRLEQIDSRIKRLLSLLTAFTVPYGWVTGDGRKPSESSLGRMKANNPRSYAWLMEYKALIEEEKELSDD